MGIKGLDVRTVKVTPTFGEHGHMDIWNIHSLLIDENLYFYNLPKCSLFFLINKMSFLHLLMLPNNVKCRQEDIKH